MNKKRTKVAVGVSGGVDSSVAAALLKEQGYEVVGIFMHFWYENVKGKVRDNVCCSLESQEDARKVCQKLEIPFYTMNMKVPFKKMIVENFLNNYEKGRTPNPCVRCNRYVKFGEFIKKAKALECDYVAMGHYARIRSKQLNKQTNKQVVKLLKAKDVEKDQTYFLHGLTQTQLKHVLFPLGEYKKDQVRKLARKFGLATASKKESQEVCFVPDGKLGEFLQRNIKMKPGKIKEFGTEKVLGEHNGLALYTLGQRKGIGLSGGPWFVLKLDMKNNVLWVTKHEKQLNSVEFEIKKLNRISGEPKLPVSVKGQVRYRSKAANATLRKKGGKIVVQMKKPQRAVTPGQFAVFYKGKECLGGGEIK
jgi:tRNA-uridine 2-sulfurtransferase